MVALTGAGSGIFYVLKKMHPGLWFKRAIQLKNLA